MKDVLFGIFEQLFIIWFLKYFIGKGTISQEGLFS